MVEVTHTREQRLRHVQNYILRMPNLSTTVTKVLEICNNPKASPNDLNRVISLDPVLTGKVLTLINSAYYGLPKRVTSLTRAIIMLGLNTVRNLALSTAVLETFGRKESFPALSMEAFWAHSLCVGVAAKALAVTKGVSVTEREEYFVAGLLHDLGKIPLNFCFPKEYLQVLDLTRTDKHTLYQSENEILDVDHCAVGEMIAGKWHLGESMNDSLSHHHNPEEASDKNRDLIAVVALANAFADTFETGFGEAPFPEDPLVNDLLDQVGVNWHALSGLGETVVNEIEKAKVFLQFTQKG